MDEPTANLDIATRREIMAVLTDMKDIVQTVVIATHDMQLVCQWADRIVVLQDGKVVADGPRDQVFSDRKTTQQVGIRPRRSSPWPGLWTREPCATPLRNFWTDFRRDKDE